MESNPTGGIRLKIKGLPFRGGPFFLAEIDYGLDTLNTTARLVIPSLEAVILTVPGATAATDPGPVIVATAGLELDQTTWPVILTADPLE